MLFANSFKKCEGEPNGLWEYQDGKEENQERENERQEVRKRGKIS